MYQNKIQLGIGTSGKLRQIPNAFSTVMKQSDRIGDMIECFEFEIDLNQIVEKIG